MYTFTTEEAVRLFAPFGRLPHKFNSRLNHGIFLKPELSGEEYLVLNALRVLFSLFERSILNLSTSRAQSNVS